MTHTGLTLCAAHAFVHSQFRHSHLDHKCKDRFRLYSKLSLSGADISLSLNFLVVGSFFLSFYLFSTKWPYFCVDFFFFWTNGSLVDIKKLKLHAAIAAVTVAFFPPNFKRKLFFCPSEGCCRETVHNFECALLSTRHAVCRIPILCLIFCQMQHNAITSSHCNAWTEYKMSMTISQMKLSK